MIQLFKVLCMSLVLASSAYAAMDEVDAKNGITAISNDAIAKANAAAAVAAASEAPKAEVKESPYAKAEADIKAAAEKAIKDVQDAASEAIAKLQDVTQTKEVAPVAPVTTQPPQLAVDPVLPHKTEPTATNDQATVKIEYAKLYETDEVTLDYTNPSTTNSCTYWEQGTASALITSYDVQGEDGTTQKQEVRLNFSCPTDLSTHPEECMVTVHLAAWRGVIELAPTGDDCKINFKNENGKLSGLMNCKLALRDDSAKMGNGAEQGGWQDLSNAVFKLDVQNCAVTDYDAQPAVQPAIDPIPEVKVPAEEAKPDVIFKPAENTQSQEQEPQANNHHISDKYPDYIAD